jgi:lipid A ethanolaminephosphotransferase
MSLSPVAPAGRLASLRRRLATLLDSLPRPQLGVEAIMMLAAAYWVLATNRSFFGQALHHRPVVGFADLVHLATLAVALWALHLLLLAPIATRHTVKPVVAVLTIAAVVGAFFTRSYGVVLDPSMLRNVLRTDTAEARELLTASLAWQVVAFAGLPLMLLSRVQVVDRPWRRALLRRVALVAGAVTVLALGVWSQFQPLSSWFRQHTEVRYLITPANLVWSSARAVAGEAKGAAQPREVIGEDVAQGPSWGARSKPLVLVLVVGETARAANWGLNGYARDTTPELARRGVVNFPRVTSCGTHTEASVPCMFAPVGRRDYDEGRIRRQQSLLHVLDRAGVRVHWRDNQSGCKGVCDGLPTDTVDPRAAPGLCADGRCLDEALVHDLPLRLRDAQGTSVWVLHMLGNHGPSYWRRYPAGFGRFQPECRQDDLARCPVEHIVNAYDNALLYTDHVLARAIDALAAASDRVDSALLYVSDHGESLGERGLYLHGLPYAIAPRQQTEVPMIAWTSPGLDRAVGVPAGCLRRALAERAGTERSHDDLFHTVLGLLDLRTRLHDAAHDLVAGCRDRPA